MKQAQVQKRQEPVSRGQKRKRQEKDESSTGTPPSIAEIAMQALSTETSINGTWAQTLVKMMDEQLTPLESLQLRHKIDGLLLATLEAKDKAS